MSASRTAKTYRKQDLPVWEIRRYLEPGPVVLVSSALKGVPNIMTLGWHTVLEFSPSLIGCMISGANHSFRTIYQTKECVINIPGVELAQTVAGIGTCSGANVDKFEKFHLTAKDAQKVSAPLIRECFANFECKVVDRSLANQYNFFILEVVKAYAPLSPKYPPTLHYRGDGLFMVSGKSFRIPALKGL